MKNYYSIGAVSKLKGLTIKALRFYDKIGLVKPAYVDPDTNYRYYSLEQLLLLEHISLFKESGATLEQISKACKDDNCIALADFCFSQIVEAQDKIAQLQEAIDKYAQMGSRIYFDKARSVNKGIYYRAIPTRSVISRPCATPPTAPATYEIYFDVYQMIREKFLSSIYATGSVVRINPRTLEFAYKEIFVEAKKTENSPDIHLQTLPAGDYLCVNYFSENRQEQLCKLFDELHKEKLVPKMMLEADTYLSVTQYEHPMMELQVLLS